MFKAMCYSTVYTYCVFETVCYSTVVFLLWVCVCVVSVLVLHFVLFDLLLLVVYCFDVCSLRLFWFCLLFDFMRSRLILFSSIVK